MPEFFRVITPERFLADLSAFARVGSETVALHEALSRVLAQRALAPEDLPPWPRSTMDGYAVVAADTFGASDPSPALLSVTREVEMGARPTFALRPGQAAPIPTGGFLPQGADAVVMVEYTALAGPKAIEVTRAVTAGENVLGQGEDVGVGETVLPPGRRLRPQDLGLLAGLGLTTLPVYRQPKVALLSTGNEVVPLGQTPGPGQVRDANGASLAATIRSVGSLALPLGIVPDDLSSLRRALDHALDQADLVVLSGGSSVGERDLLARAICGLEGASVLAHGVAISPGKPTLLARAKHKAILGLPGHPASALIVAQVFLAPFLHFLEGQDLVKGPLGPRIQALLPTGLPSAQGREEYIRVRLEIRGDQTLARPLFGRSAMLSPLVRADGLVMVPLHAEGIPAGEMVEVTLY